MPNPIFRVSIGSGAVTAGEDRELWRITRALISAVYSDQSYDIDDYLNVGQIGFSQVTRTGGRQYDIEFNEDIDTPRLSFSNVSISNFVDVDFDDSTEISSIGFSEISLREIFKSVDALDLPKIAFSGVSIVVPTISVESVETLVINNPANIQYMILNDE